MKSLEIIKKIVTVVSFVLIALDMLTSYNFLPYGLLGLCIFELIKIKDYADVKNKNMAILAGISAAVALLAAVLSFYISLRGYEI